MYLCRNLLLGTLLPYATNDSFLNIVLIMVDDDLDAFFDDVDNAVKDAEAADDDDAVKEGETDAAVVESSLPNNNHDNNDEGRPTKRARTVVASSVPVVSIFGQMPLGGDTIPTTSQASTTTSTITMINPVLPPPLLPPNNGSQQSNTTQPPPPPTLPTMSTNGKAHARSAAGTTWSDPTLSQWPENDFRLFVGNLARDLKQTDLENHFASKYPSFHMARIMIDKTTGKSRGYGFVSLMDARDCARAIRECDQSWLGSRPMKVKLSEWKDREWKEVVKKKGWQDKRKKKHFGL